MGSELSIDQNRIPEGWLETTLGAVGDFRNGVNFNRTQEGAGLPVIKVKDFESRSVAPSIGYDELDPGLIRVPDSQMLEQGDTLIVRSNGNIALVGRSMYVDHLARQTTFSGFCIRFRPDRRRIDPKFAGYLIRSPLFRERFSAYGTGTGIQNLSQGILNEVPVLLPSLGDQREIATTLGSLDDKITLLRETNATLEAIAQAIFKSWFVDFDPVHARAEGRDPEGVPPEVADLFPSEFEDSELGAIPKGWKAGTLGEISTNVRSQARPDEFSDEIAYIGLEHMPRKSIALSEWEDATKVDSAKSRFKQGQILFGKLRPYFHKVGIAPLDGVCSTDILVIEPKTPAHRSLCVCHLSSTRLVDYATQLSNGAKMPRTSWQDLARFGIAVPPKQVAAAFNETAEPLFERIVESVHQARALSDLRDTLLPRLTSGKLRLCDVEKVSV